MNKLIDDTPQFSEESAKPENSVEISWSGIKNQVFQHKKPLFFAHVIALLAALVSVPIPLMMPLLVDEVLLDKPAGAINILNQLLPEQWHDAVGYIIAILVAVITMRLLSLVLGVWQSRQFTIIGKDISLKIRERLFNHLPKVTLQEYETQGSAAISSRCVTDVETLDKFISQTLARFLISILTVIGTAVILLWIDLQLGLIILLLNPVVIFFSRSFGKHVKQLKKKENAAFEAMQQALVETLDAITQLKAARREQEYFSKVKLAALDLKNHAIQSQWKTDAVNKLSFTVFLVGFEIFRATAMLMVVFSGLSVGQIFAVFGYLWFMMGPVQELLSMQYAYYSASAALKRLNEVLNFTPESNYPEQVNPFILDPQISIEYRKLNFSYEAGKPVLKDVNLTVPAGKKVAIVAVSGGGKSTLIQLLLGLYEKDSGDILVNEVAVEQIGYTQMRNQIATVLQQPILFNTSVRENLSMGRAGIEEGTLWEALEIAELKDTVEQLDKGLETAVGRNGVRLSGGQQQRLAIARMVLQQPKVVVLDEATSALDTEVEAKIHKNLQTFLHGKTTIIVAHRLSAIKQADIIYVLDDGQVSQSGEHDSLIAQQGLYQTLYARNQN